MSIETSRLGLIPVSQDYTREIYDNFNEDIILYMAPSVSKDITETKKVVEMFIQQRKDHTDHVYAITLKSSGEFLGLIGLHNLKSDLPEIGIWTKLSSHGNHYGREAVGGILDHARRLGIQKVVYPVDRRNMASKKIPLYYGGKVINSLKIVVTKDGRTLEEEIYEIDI